MTLEVDDGERLGTREAATFSIDWNLPRRSLSARRGRSNSSRAGVAVEGVVTNLSVSGAAVRAVTSPDLVVGSPVRIGLENAYGTAVVCRISAVDTPDESLYGVAFVDLPKPLRDLLWSHLGIPEIVEN